MSEHRQNINIVQITKINLTPILINMRGCYFFFFFYTKYSFSISLACPIYREDALVYSIIKLPQLLDSIQSRAKPHYPKLSPNHLTQAQIQWQVPVPWALLPCQTAVLRAGSCSWP